MKISMIKEYIDIIKEEISELIFTFKEKKYSNFEEDLENFKNILETFTGDLITLNPYINSLYNFIKEVYEKNQSPINSKFYSITCQYLGEVYHFYMEFQQASEFFYQAFLINRNIKLLIKIIEIQIIQQVKSNRDSAFIINKKIVNLPQKLSEKEDLHTESPQEQFLQILDVGIELSNNIKNFANPNIKKKQKKNLIKQIKQNKNDLMENGINIIHMNIELENLLNNI